MNQWGTIETAYDAYWFLHEHPKYKTHEYTRAEDGDTDASKHYRIVECPRGLRWKEWKIERHSIETNLSIHYGRNADGHVYCALEFGGPMENEGASCGYWDNDGPRMILETHDIELDVAEPTFEQSLIAIARIVLARDGDFDKPEWVGRCDEE